MCALIITTSARSKHQTQRWIATKKQSWVQLTISLIPLGTWQIAHGFPCAKYGQTKPSIKIYYWLS